jgi:GntR family transcriptional regulator, transcriptional repressor for pyruvate dehydrogenase complex
MKISDEICIELQKAIFRGKYPARSRFPSERELAGKYQVSRPVIREAVAKLVQLGLVETRPQSGTYVSDYQTEGSIDLLIHIMKSNKAIDSETLVSLLRVRSMTESFIAREAALQAMTEDLSLLREAGDELIATIRKRPDDIQRLSELDFKFHAALARASHNLVSQLLFNSFKPMYQYYADYYYTLKDTHPVTIAFVGDLIQALGEKDEDRAEAVMKKAALFSEERVTEALGLGDVNRVIKLQNRY